jgi:hypothetical protein
MAPAFHTVTVSLVYLLWNRCRRTRQRSAAPLAQSDHHSGSDEQLEYRLDSLTVLAKPLPRRGR